MKHNNIYLVGFMGCGKTSVLKKIRQKIQSNTFDLDENIEKKHGSISKIFESKGEKYFRQIELETFQMLPKNDSVVALGGGSLEIKNIFDELKNNGFTFYLKDTFENLWNQIQNTERPLVKEGKDITILSTSYMLTESIEASKVLKKEYSITSDINPLIEKIKSDKLNTKNFSI